MLKEIYTAALGMLPQQTRLEITTNNIANANTTGFKRLGVFEQSLIDARENQLNIRGDAEQEDPPTQTFTDYSEGSLQKTDNPLDLSIAQQGFFVLQDEDGNESLTRNGHFVLDTVGRITTPDGKFLMGDQGYITANTRNDVNGFANTDRSTVIRVNPQGEVFANDQMVGRLQIMNVENPQTLLRVGSSEFSATEETEMSQLQPENVRLQQGFLETSNVNIINEMVTLIQLQRSFEMGQKVISTNDGTLERSIDIGRFS